MPEFSPEIVELAWQAAHAANHAFDEGRMHDFYVAGSMAALVMSPFALGQITAPEQFRGGEEAPASPATQKIGETGLVNVTGNVTESGPEAAAPVFDFGNPLRAIDEIQAFAAWRRYPRKLVTVNTNILYREAVEIPVETFEDYIPEPTKDIHLNVAVLGQKDPEIALKNIDPTHIRIDIASMHATVSGWLKLLAADAESLPRNVGPATLSFFADYLNHALPDADPLPIPKPFTPAPELTMTMLETMNPAQLREIILERYIVDGEERWLVGHAALRRFVAYTGHDSGITGAFLTVFDALASEIMPTEPSELAIPPRTSRPVRVHDDLVSLRRSSQTVKLPNGRGDAAVTSHWGIKPRRFVALITAENQRVEQGWPRRISGYGPLSQKIISEYIDLLTRKGLSYTV